MTSDEIQYLRESWVSLPEPNDLSRRSARARLFEEMRQEPLRHDPKRKSRRQGRLAIVVLLFAALMSIGATVAFALGVVSVDFNSAEKASPTSPPFKEFAQLDEAAPAGMPTGVIAGETRIVTSYPLTNGGSVVLAVAPTQSGGFCASFSGGAGGGCDRDRTVPFSRGISVPGRIAVGATKIDGHVFVTGWTLIHAGTSVDVVFEDAKDVELPLTWVSRPIDAGFFFYDVPVEHRANGHAPIALVFRDAGGDALHRASLPSIFSFLVQQTETGG